MNNFKCIFSKRKKGNYVKIDKCGKKQTKYLRQK